MNIINKFKQITKIATNLTKNNNNFLREYAVSVKDYKITWERPEKVSNLLPEKTGDLGLNIDIKPTDLCYMYSDSEELKDASDIVKKMFTLQFFPNQETHNVRGLKIMELVKRHEFDELSPEVRIAFLTNEIHHMQEYIKNNRTHSKGRVILKEMIDKRRKYLAKLRKHDYKRFEWVLEKLNLVYKPFPENPLQVTRKESLTRLTEKHCNKLIQEKLNAYKAQLNEMQKDFFIEKAKKLAFIQKEEIACGLQPTVNEEDIALANEKAKKYQI